MDSSTPPPPAASERNLRPWYLVPGMALTWCVGVQALTSGISSIEFLRHGTLPDVVSAEINMRGTLNTPELFAYLSSVYSTALVHDSRIIFPLIVAQLLLGATLVVGSGLAMTARRGARNFTLQALLANAVLGGVAYALTRGVRVECIEAVARFAETLPLSFPQRTFYATREMLWWSVRMHLVLIELFPFALGAFVLTRPRTKLYFEAVARAAERAEDP